jgi:hypothetical protein
MLTHLCVPLIKLYSKVPRVTTLSSSIYGGDAHGGSVARLDRELTRADHGGVAKAAPSLYLLQ